MKKENKEKGFSLVELLAVVVILGLLSTIAIIGVNAIIKNAEKNYYETQKNTLTMAAQSYAQDNRNSLPKTIGSSTEITLKTLQDKKYVDEIKNRQGATCDATKSYVKIFKYSKDGYNYTSYLVCPGYENETENTENAGPTIKLEYKDSGKYTDKNDTIEIASYKSPKVIINIERKNDGENKGKNILSYNYVIYRCITNASNEEVCTTEIKNSGSIEAHQQAKITEELNVKEYLSNKIKIVVSSVDEYGNTTTLTKYLKLNFKDGPQCELISDSDNPWINNATAEISREIKVKCIDTNGSGCEKEIYSQIFTGETYKGTITIKDNSGKETICEVDVKIDTTAPATPKLTNPYDNKWTNKDYNVTAESSDATSGVKKFQYRYPNSKDPEEQNWKDFSEKDKDKIQIPQTKERSETLEVRACDAAGNCSEAAKTTIKIDKTAPTCKVTKSIANPNGPNNWYISTVDVNLTTGNPTSGAVTAVASKVSYGFATTNQATYNSKTKYTQGDTTGVTYYGFVKDEAGNTNTCKSSSIKVDTTAPTTPKLTNPYDNKWVNFNYDVTVKSTDVTSGIAYFEYRNSNTETTWNKHTNTGKNTVKISYKNDGEYKLEVRACDAVGNCSASATTTIKIDKVAPTCSITKGDIGSQNGVSATVNCSDDRSGCSQASTTYSEITSNKSYYVTDAAGNKSAACSISVSSYSCNPYQAVCGSKKCGATCLVYADNHNANCYACGLESNCCGCTYNYCNVYCTYWNTCYK